MAVGASASIAVVESSAAGERWAPLPNATFGADFPAAATVDIDRSTTGQTIAGFGGAFTESAAFNFASLGADAQAALLGAYWSAAGLGYTYGRVPMNSADFSLSSYSEDNTTADYALADFDTALTRDHEYMVPFVKAAMAASASPLRLYISPWSPPAWMKTNDAMVGSFNPCLLADPRVHAAWAAYFVRFIQGYTDAGVPLWGLTAQNEPLTDAGMRYEVSAPARSPAAVAADCTRAQLHPELKWRCHEASSCRPSALTHGAPLSCRNRRCNASTALRGGKTAPPKAVRLVQHATGPPSSVGGVGL